MSFYDPTRVVDYALAFQTLHLQNHVYMQTKVTACVNVSEQLTVLAHERIARPRVRGEGYFVVAVWFAVEHFDFVLEHPLRSMPQLFICRSENTHQFF